MINKFDESTSHTHPTMWKFVIILNCLFRVIEKKERKKRACSGHRWNVGDVERGLRIMAYNNNTRTQHFVAVRFCDGR